MIRLAHKYLMDSLQRQALLALRLHFPSQFVELGHTPPGWDPLYGVELAHLARLTNQSTLLPIAFYACVSAGDRITDGWQREDGSVINLSPEDFKCYVRGSPLFWDAIRRVIDNTFRIDRDAMVCEMPDGCFAKLQAFNENHLHSWYTTSDCFYPGEDGIERHMRWGYGLCPKCSEMIQQRHRAARHLFALSLSKIFSFGDPWKSSNEDSSEDSSQAPSVDSSEE